jgi:membrane protease YdiL (CAAX protease family)
VQRTNHAPTHIALVFTVLTLLVVTVLCGVFLAAGWTLPDWIVVVGRWVPALVSLVVMRLYPLPGGVATWWALRPGGWRRLLLGSAVAVAILLASYGATALLGSVLGIVAPLPWADLSSILLFVVPFVLVYSLSTFGEEVAWRGYLQRLLSGWGFWRASAAIAAVWVLFHVPLHGTLALQGTLPWQALLGSTLLLFPLGLLLSAAVCRFGSVWPAVFAHALPMSALNLVRDPGALTDGPFWTFTALSALVLTAAAILLAPRRAAEPTP